LKDLESQVRGSQVKEITSRIEAGGKDLSEIIAKKARFVLYGIAVLFNHLGVISKHSLINDLSSEMPDLKPEEIRFLAHNWDPTGKNIIDVQDMQEFLKIYTKVKKVSTVVFHVLDL
jgi:hypothetical protein